MIDPVLLEVTSEVKFVESHYCDCIDFYEIDLSNGCDVGCIYCGLAKKNNDSEYLDINSVLEGPAPNKGIYLSPNSDPFYGIAAEKSHRLLERFLPEGVPFVIITKSFIPDKTIKLMSRYPQLIIPKISLARLDQELNSYIEPRAASVKIRLDNMKRLSESGLKVVALMMPMYFSLDDTQEKLEEIINEFSIRGVSILKASYVLIRKGTSKKDQYILEKMKDHNRLKTCLEFMTDEIEPHIGNASTVPFGMRTNLYKRLSQICTKHNIKFCACSVLDPEIFSNQNNGFVKCKNVWIFRKKRGLDELPC